MVSSQADHRVSYTPVGTFVSPRRDARPRASDPHPRICINDLNRCEFQCRFTVRTPGDGRPYVTARWFLRKEQKPNFL